MTAVSVPSIVLSAENLDLLAKSSAEVSELKGDLSSIVNKIFPFGISRYKALVKDAAKRGTNPPGERSSRAPRAPRAVKPAASRDAVTELINADTTTPKRRGKQLDLPAETAAATTEQPAVDKEKPTDPPPAADVAPKLSKKEAAKIASLEAAKAAEADKIAKAAAEKTAKKTAASAKKGAGKKDEPTSTGIVWWVVKIGKQEVQVSAHKDDRDGAIKEALEQIPGAKLSQVKSAEIEEVE